MNALLSVLALAQVVNHLDRPLNAAGYATGVAVGVYLGVVLDQRFSREPIEFRVLVAGDADTAVNRLRDSGWSVIRQTVEGAGGSASVLVIVVEAELAPRLTEDLDRVVPDGFRTTSRLTSALAGMV